MGPNGVSMAVDSGPNAVYLANKENRFVLKFPDLARRSRSDRFWTQVSEVEIDTEVVKNSMIIHVYEYFLQKGAYIWTSKENIINDVKLFPTKCGIRSIQYRYGSK